MSIEATLLLWIASLAAGAQAGPPPQASAADLYARLERNEATILQNGASAKELAEGRSIRREFVRLGDSGCDFLIAKLDKINRALATIARTDGDWLSDSVIAMDTKDSMVKYEMFKMLADAYPRVSLKQRHRVLRALYESYTPVLASLGGGVVLDESFVRIGKDSVDTEIRLAHSASEVVRCRAFDILNSLMEEASGATAASRPPKFSCRADVKTRNRDVSRWRDWWIRYRSVYTFPTLPDEDAPQ